MADGRCDRFIVLAPERAGGDPAVWYWSDEESVYVNQHADPRQSDRLKGLVLIEIVVDTTVPENFPASMCPEHFSTIQAIAGLDAAGGPCHFRDALAAVFEMGMSAQRELERKQIREFNRQEREEAGLS